MGLLDNYVAAVKRHLPPRLRDDVGDELHSTLADSIDAMEEATGRPLSEAEVAELLKRRGHPLLVASAYRGDRGLVGAEMFPIYLRVLKAALIIVGMVVLADYLFGDGVAQIRDLTRLLHRFYWPALQVFAVVTLAFYATEAWMKRTQFLQRWNPLHLPTSLDLGRHRATATLHSLAYIAALVLVVKFLLHGAFLQGLLPRFPAPVSIELAPAWAGTVQWAAAALCAIVIVLTVSAWAQGYWNRFLLWLSVVASALLAVVLFWIVAHPDAFVTRVHSDALAADSESIVLGCRIFIGVVAAISVHNAIRRAGWLRRPDQETA